MEQYVVDGGGGGFQHAKLKLLSRPNSHIHKEICHHYFQHQIL